MSSTSVQQTIEQRLQQQFSPSFLEVINESSQHNVPAGSESHFKVTIVTEQFDGLRLIQRHRQVNQCLADVIAEQIHALALHTYTPEQWQQQQQQSPDSPNCLGGSKR